MQISLTYEGVTYSNFTEEKLLEKDVPQSVIDAAKNKKSIEDLKKERDDQVSQLTVTIRDNIVLDADEQSQGRLTRALIKTEHGGAVEWICHDNSTEHLQQEDIMEALAKAAAAQERIFIDYNDKRMALLEGSE